MPKDFGLSLGYDAHVVEGAGEAPPDLELHDEAQVVRNRGGGASPAVHFTQVVEGTGCIPSQPFIGLEM